MNANCRGCGATLDVSLDSPETQAPCPACGSPLRNYTADIVETVVARDGIGMKVRRAGERKPYFEESSGPNFSARLQKLVYRERVFDRDRDRYFEMVKDYESGDVIHHCDEPLSQHIGHGSAKPKAQPIEG